MTAFKGILSLDEQFFVQLILKNGLLEREAVDECIRKKLALRKKRGVERYIAEIMLDEGLLQPEEVDEIHEAQAASQILRLDSLYADIALSEGRVSQRQIEEGFAVQRERRFQARLGEVLIEQGLLTVEHHKNILTRLLRQIEQEELEYIKAIRVRKKYTAEVPVASDVDSAPEAAQPNVIHRGPAAHENPVENSSSGDLPAPANAPPVAAPEAGRRPTPTAPPKGPTGPAPARSPLPARAAAPKAAHPRPAGPAPKRPPFALPRAQGDDPDDSDVLKPDSGIEEFHKPPPDLPPRPASPFLESNIQVIRSGDPRGKHKMPLVASASIAGKPPKKQRMEDLLTSAIEERETSQSPIRSVFLETEIHNLKEEIKNAESILAQSSSEFSNQNMAMLSQIHRPVFDAKAYIQKKRSRSRVKVFAAIGVAALAILIMGSLALTYWSQRSAFSKAEAAMKNGRLWEAEEALAGLGGLFGNLGVDGKALDDLRAEIGFLRRMERDLRPALDDKDFDAAQAAAERLAEDFPGEAYQTRIEATKISIDFEKHLSTGQKASLEGRRDSALAAFRAAQSLAKNPKATADLRADTRADEGVSGVRKQLIEKIKSGEDALKFEIGQAREDKSGVQRARSELMALYKEAGLLFPSDREFQDQVIRLEIDQWLQSAEEALARRDYGEAVEWFKHASSVRPDDVELKFKLQHAEKLKFYAKHLSDGRQFQEQGSYREAIAQYKEALTYAIDSSEANTLIRECESLEEARDEARRVAELQTAGVAAMKEGRLDEALRNFERVQFLDDRPENAEIVDYLRSVQGMVYVPPGAFFRGSDAAGPASAPQHQATLARGYMISIHEITNQEYHDYVAANPGLATPQHWTRVRKRDDGSSYKSHDPTYSRHPIVYVSWDDAQAFCRWAGKRLPTEIEWEKAARGTDGRTYPWGEANELDIANVQSQAPINEGIGTVSVGSKPRDRSPYGCLDMGGNVSEWVNDFFTPYPGAAPDAIPQADRDKRVLRGGSWLFNWANARCFNRQKAAADRSYREVGFRTASDIPEALYRLLEATP